MSGHSDEERILDDCEALLAGASIIDGPHRAVVRAIVQGLRQLSSRDTIPALIEARMIKGQALYGVLDVAGDPRDWAREARDELLDALVYIACARLRADRP